MTVNPMHQPPPFWSAFIRGLLTVAAGKGSRISTIRLRPGLMKHAFACTAIALVIYFPVKAQLAPHNRMSRFSIPTYNADSYREWTLSGEEGIYKEDNRFEVTNMKLSIFSGDAEQNLDTVIQSSSAVFDLAGNRATSDAPIHISSANFEIHGEGWSWDGTQGRVVIEKSVTIRFSQKLDLDLNHLL